MAVPTGTVVPLEQKAWCVDEPLGEGGFGKVYAATGPDNEQAALKFVPLNPKATREFDVWRNANGLPNVLPLWDEGKWDDQHVLAMPRAECDLRAYLRNRNGGIPVDEAKSILADIAKALVAIDGRVVHRDLKPENVLCLNGSWHIADFGIARYAEAATASQTWKGAGSNRYAAPEVWKLETPTARTDIYAFGIMAYEMLSGEPPFIGPAPEDYRQQHLLDVPSQLPGVPRDMASLIAACLVKEQSARLPIDQVVRVLDKVNTARSSTDSRLQALNLKAQERAATRAAAAEAKRIQEERHESLFVEARASWARIIDKFSQHLSENLYAAERHTSGDGLEATLEHATLAVGSVADARHAKWGNYTPSFDVIAHTRIAVQVDPQPTLSNYHIGRSHSFWFCDAVQADLFQWFELAFVEGGVAFITAPYTEPTALSPGRDAGAALTSPSGTWKLALPFKAILPDVVDSLVDEWMDFFVDTIEGTLVAPGRRGAGYGSFRTT